MVGPRSISGTGSMSRLAAGHDSRGSGKKTPGHGLEAPGGFIKTEVLVALALVLALLVGMVLLLDGAVGSKGGGGDAYLSREGDRVLDEVESLMTSAPSVGAVKIRDSLNSRVTLLADLDGDLGTGGYRVAGKEGFELVQILRTRTDSDRLVARVSNAPAGGSKTVTLTELLEAREPRAFDVEWLDSGGSRRQVRVSIKLKREGESREFTREFSVG